MFYVQYEIDMLIIGALIQCIRVAHDEDIGVQPDTSLLMKHGESHHIAFVVRGQCRKSRMQCTRKNVLVQIGVGQQYHICIVLTGHAQIVFVDVANHGWHVVHPAVPIGKNIDGVRHRGFPLFNCIVYQYSV